MKDFIDTIRALDWTDFLHLMGWVVAGFVTAALLGKEWL